MGVNAIEARDLSKRYHVYDTPLARVRHALWPRATHGIRQIKALEDISFDVAQGESVGIIGRNGSGKSTLLEIITGTLEPTAGSVKVVGRIAALLELGSGFNPEYSGRENVFLNGLLMGLDRTAIENRFDDIVGFADIGDVLDHPVKTYSSGMLVRLAFSVQVALQPDILIVDEALSVGDYFFQQKCFGRLRKMREAGLTLLFVSHDMGSVRDICSRAICLASGRMMFMGDSKLAIAKYINQVKINGEDVVHGSTETVNRSIADAGIRNLSIEDSIWKASQESILGQAKESRIIAVIVKNKDGEIISSQLMGEKIYLTVVLEVKEKDSGHVTLSIKNKYDQIINSSSTWGLNILPLTSTDGSTLKGFEFEIDCMIEAGQYSFMVTFSKPTNENTGVSKDSTGWFGPFDVRWDYENSRAPFLGMFGLPVSGKSVEIEI